MKYLKIFEEYSDYTLNDYINDSFRIYNEQFAHDAKWKGTVRESFVPNLVIGRAFSGLLLLTQSTNKEQGLTETIVEIAKVLYPIMRNIGKYNLEKYNNLMNIDSSLHNRHYDDKEYINRVVAVCPPLEFIQTCYFESDEDAPFDLNKYSELYSKIKKEASKVFDSSIWKKK